MSKSKLEVLTPANCQLIFIDHQPQMAFGVRSIDRQTLKNNVVGLARAAKVFGIPTTITTVETESFSGHTYPELLDVFPDTPLLERTSMNSWDDQKVRDQLAPSLLRSGLSVLAGCADYGPDAMNASRTRRCSRSRRCGPCIQPRLVNPGLHKELPGT
jgi:hypothetical protein